MPAAIYNPVLDKGADYSFALVFKDNSGNPISLSSVTLSSKILPKEGSSNQLGAFTITPDGTTPGRAVFTLPAATSAAIAQSKPYYEIWVTYTSTGLKQRYVKGILNLDP